ncbi:hypothetical protein [Methanobrevibacter arboriphilus]|uniref:hypothetical protein n=1 Tax=Methanobrevibacter arboriphilus TaxID=39441 RepID=UPI000AC342ED|nr:hypothetical protein [Methanobrevibacter arboriphilus]
MIKSLKKYSISFQEILLVSGIFTVASEILAILIIFVVFLLILFIFLSIIFNFDLLISIVLAIAIPPGFLACIIIYKSEKKEVKM